MSDLINDSLALAVPEEAVLAATTPSFFSTHLILPDDLGYEEWANTLRNVVRMQQSSMWWIGDAIIYGKDHYDEAITKACEITGYALKTVKMAVSMAAKFPPSTRFKSLEWAHHLAVAALPAHEQAIFLESAVTGHWSVGEIRKQVKARKGLPENGEFAPAQELEEQTQTVPDVLPIDRAKAEWLTICNTLRKFESTHGFFSEDIYDFITRGSIFFSQSVKKARAAPTGSSNGGGVESAPEYPDQAAEEIQVNPDGSESTQSAGPDDVDWFSDGGVPRVPRAT